MYYYIVNHIVFISILFINDYGLCKYLLFADDLKMYLPIISMNSCDLLQHDLYKFSDWCFKNGLSVNVEKCKCIFLPCQKSNSFFPYTIDGFPFS